MTKIIDVCGTYLGDEARLQKKAKTFQQFGYKSSCIPVFENIMGEKLNAISDSISDISKDFDDLVTAFEEFTNYNEIMGKSKSDLNRLHTSIHNSIHDAIRAARDAVQDHVQQDESFQSDLDQLNNILASGTADGGFSH